eukprot:1307894-Amphidinium_carterae.1
MHTVTARLVVTPRSCVGCQSFLALSWRIGRIPVAWSWQLCAARQNRTRRVAAGLVRPARPGQSAVAKECA